MTNTLTFKKNKEGIYALELDSKSKEPYTETEDHVIYEDSDEVSIIYKRGTEDNDLAKRNILKELIRKRVKEKVMFFKALLDNLNNN